MQPPDTEDAAAAERDVTPATGRSASADAWHLRRAPAPPPYLRRSPRTSASTLAPTRARLARDTWLRSSHTRCQHG